MVPNCHREINETARDWTPDQRQLWLRMSKDVCTPEYIVDGLAPELAVLLTGKQIRVYRDGVKIVAGRPLSTLSEKELLALKAVVAREPEVGLTDEMAQRASATSKYFLERIFRAVEADFRAEAQRTGIPIPGPSRTGR
ncbi:hypothetical protein ACVW0Y_004435 [Pseudomonas sp. TE3786]